jgi:hypothetical protein
MKKIIFILLVSFFSVSLHAQLAHTKWKAVLQPNDPVEVLFSFGTDSLTVTRVDNGLFVENMIFSDKDSVFTVQKISGGSDCDTGITGQYRFTRHEEGILVTVISDDCSHRSSLLDKTIWIKQ